MLEKIKKMEKTFNTLEPILLKIIDAGGVAYLVGGFVRDFVLKSENIFNTKDSKDIDIEVHKLSLTSLELVLKGFGPVRLVGKKFGVLRIDGINVDWSLPRKDSIGRHPEVKVDPEMNIKDALRRRDVTMNAMAINLNNYMDHKKLKLSEIIDPFNGLNDIKEKQLRVVDKKLFLDDPLRFFRVMQFIGRFEMMPDKELDYICKTINLKDLNSDKIISKERIFDEIKKLLLKSKKPSLGFRWLKDIGRLSEIFPEIYELIGLEQRSDYHPEGDVFEHTMQSIDAAASITYNGEAEKLLILLSVLCHDFGKVLTTDEKLSSKGHEKAGVKIAKRFLKRITNNKILIDGILKLVLHHMKPFVFLDQNAKKPAYKRLALKLAPQTNMRQLAMVALSDKRGRNEKKGEPLVDVYNNEYELFLIKAQSANVEFEPEKPVLLGRDILNIVKPGPEMGKVLKRAYEIQIEEGVTDKEELKKRVL